MENQENNRKGEEVTPHFRSGRFYSISNEWYFSVREQQDQGPFPTKLSAEENLKLYLKDYAHFGMTRGEFDINKIKLN